ncbi:hypothetical protein FRB95_011351 [Tulasnella sp. JGI-2019a]|nr:hypothetical protein FRB95_011351 [Tulasnella sp. JGI-2019a]
MPPSSRRCELCAMTVVGGEAVWLAHQAGARHQRLVAAQPAAAQPATTAPPISFFCDPCKRKFKTQMGRDQHCTTASHHAKLKDLAHRATIKDAENNKFGVTVAPGAVGVNLGIIPVNHWAQNRSLVIRVSSAALRLVSVNLSTTMFSLTSGYTFPIPLDPGQPFTLSIDFNARKQLGLRGHFNDRAELRFENTALQQAFTIVRSLKAIIGSQADYDLLRAKAPFVRQKRRQPRPNGRFIPGPRRALFSSIPYIGRLGKYPIDRSVIVAGPEEERIQIVRAILPQDLTAETYARHWHTLLHVEEEQMMRDIEVYDMVNTVLHPVDNLFYRRTRPRRKSTLGRVIKLHQTQLGLKFDHSFSYTPGELCDVRFTVTRIPIRRMHEALDIPFFPDRVLFPGEAHLKGQCLPDDEDIAEIEVFNPLLVTNRPQMDAIVAILAQQQGSPPFIVFGPPGTGKTVTIVEAILQLVARDPDVRILACAPSNSAADLLAERLKSGLGPDKLFRLNAPFRGADKFPVTLLDYTFIDEGERFSIRSAGDLAKYNVVVSTCMSATIPHGVGMETGHFGYIFVDEAGQAMEPEAMVPIKTISDPRTNIILSGDPLQLGPIIRSGVARTLGLGVSFLERLMRREIYDEKIWHGITVVKLTKNFRSHDAILHFPNTHFYGSELQVCGDREVIDRFVGSPVLPNRKFPVVFHGVSGEDDRESDSPSYFNIAEVSVVADYIDRLLHDASRPLDPKEIGVIAPYRAQSKKLRQKFNGEYVGLKVGSVEEYQGQEREVIILTTVRTDREQVTYDLRHTLGFLVNPRRLNVAITRPKGLLIIVGDPLVLGLDPLWRKLLNYIHLNGGWTGRAPDWDTAAVVDNDPDTLVTERENRRDADMEELTRRLMDVVVGGGVGASSSAPQDYEEEQLETSGDRAWREYL